MGLAHAIDLTQSQNRVDCGAEHSGQGMKEESVNTVRGVPQAYVHFVNGNGRRLCERLHIPYKRAFTEYRFVEAQSRYIPLHQGILVRLEDIAVLERETLQWQNKIRPPREFMDALRPHVRRLFPSIPDEDLDACLKSVRWKHWPQVGWGDDRVANQVCSFARHQKTSYEDLLYDGLHPEDAREIVNKDWQSLVEQWKLEPRITEETMGFWQPAVSDPLPF